MDWLSAIEERRSSGDLLIDEFSSQKSTPASSASSSSGAAASSSSASQRSPPAAAAAGGGGGAQGRGGRRKGADRAAAPSSSSSSSSSSSASSSRADPAECQICTFINKPPVGRACAMCGRLLRGNLKRREASSSRKGQVKVTKSHKQRGGSDDADRATPLTSNVGDAHVTKIKASIPPHRKKPKKHIAHAKQSKHGITSKTKKKRKSRGSAGDVPVPAKTKKTSKQVHWRADVDPINRNSNSENDDFDIVDVQDFPLRAASARVKNPPRRKKAVIKTRLKSTRKQRAASSVSAPPVAVSSVFTSLSNTRKFKSSLRPPAPVTATTISASLSQRRQASYSSSSLMWIDKYEPRNFVELIRGVHKLKAQAIQKWIRDACRDNNASSASSKSKNKNASKQSYSSQIPALHPRLLILHGPSGTGKSAAVLAVAREENIALRKWSGRHADGELGYNESKRLRDQSYRSGRGRDDASLYSRSHKSSELEDFREFLFRNQRYKGLSLKSSATASSSASESSSGEDEEDDKDCSEAAPDTNARSLMLVEHLPNLYGGGGGSSSRRNVEKCAEFHSVLLEYLRVPSNAAMPAVVVYSGDGDQAPSPSDLSAVFSDAVLQSSRTVLLKTNPVNATALKRVLSAIGAAEGYTSHEVQPHVEAISGSCLGDLRHAIMSLQFALYSGGKKRVRGVEPLDKRQSKKKIATHRRKRPKKSKKSDKAMASHEAAAPSVVLGCGRDATFSMLHSLGKLLRCKRIDIGPFNGRDKTSKKYVDKNKTRQKPAQSREPLSGIAGMLASPAPSTGIAKGDAKGNRKVAGRNDAVVVRMAAHVQRISEKYELDSSSSDSDPDSDREGRKPLNRSRNMVDLISDTDEIDEIGMTPAPKKKQSAGKKEKSGQVNRDFDWDELDVAAAASGRNGDDDFQSPVKPARPRLDFCPEEIVEGTGIHVSSVLDFISHNSPEFFSDIGELDKAFETLSTADLVMCGGSSSGFGSGVRMWHREFQQSLSSGIATSLVGRAVADANLHPSDRLRQFKPVKRSLASGVVRARDANFATIRRTLSSGMKSNCGLLSRTWLEASSAVSRDAVTTALPLAAKIRSFSSSSSSSSQRDGRAEHPGLDSVLRQMNQYSSGGGKRNVGERSRDGTFVGTWKIANVWNKSNVSNPTPEVANLAHDTAAGLTNTAEDEDEIGSW